LKRNETICYCITSFQISTSAQPNVTLHINSGFTSPPYSFELEQKNKNFLKTNTRKWEIYKIAQENVLMQKRLAETKSCFYKRDDKSACVSQRGRTVMSSRENHPDDRMERIHSDHAVGEVNTHEETSGSSKQLVFKKLAYMGKLGLYEAQLYVENNK
jgi:hypothetical protein